MRTTRRTRPNTFWRIRVCLSLHKITRKKKKERKTKQKTRPKDSVVGPIVISRRSLGGRANFRAASCSSCLALLGCGAALAGRKGFFSFITYFSAKAPGRNSRWTEFDRAGRLDSTQLVEPKGARRADSSASARILY